MERINNDIVVKSSQKIGDLFYGLNLFDYGARHYDAAIGRLMNMDPLTKGYYNISPYAYCANNPVNFIDLDGRREWPVNPIPDKLKIQ
jgi:RHS repeat-associated protein